MKHLLKKTSTTLLKKSCKKTDMQQLYTACVFYLYETKMPTVLEKRMKKQQYYLDLEEFFIV